MSEGAVGLQVGAQGLDQRGAAPAVVLEDRAEDLLTYSARSGWSLGARSRRTTPSSSKIDVRFCPPSRLAAWSAIDASL